MASRAYFIESKLLCKLLRKLKPYKSLTGINVIEGYVKARSS